MKNISFDLRRWVDDQQSTARISPLTRPKTLTRSADTVPITDPSALIVKSLPMISAENVAVNLQPALRHDPDTLAYRSSGRCRLSTFLALRRPQTATTKSIGVGQATQRSVCVGTSTISPSFSEVAIFKQSLHSSQTERPISRTRQRLAQAERYLWQVGNPKYEKVNVSLVIRRWPIAGPRQSDCSSHHCHSARVRKLRPARPQRQIATSPSEANC